ncbi:MAG: hypothetical protein JKY65_21325 [Planctomycetes bacterium]|nr:hypothetical protein [Planctomycetota bacterium]
MTTLRQTLLPGLIALILVAQPSLAQPVHPFGGEVLDLAAAVEGVRTGATPAARTLAAESFLKTLYRDPFLAKLGPRMHLERWLSELAEGKAFEATAFRAAAKSAIEAGGVTEGFIQDAELSQKLEVLEMAFTAPRAARPLATAGPIDAEALSNHRLTGVLGSKDTRVLAMESVPGARVLRVSETVALGGSGSRTAIALDLYGRVLAPTEGARGSLRAGLAHREVGRAVLGAPVLHPAGASTADVLKGVGPTPWANNQNRFNHKATGTFPLAEAVRDWEKTEFLRSKGVAVYEPVAVVALPYVEWSKIDGWRPVSVYVRRARENLRVSDLDHLSTSRKRRLVAELKAKIEAEMRGVGRTEKLSDVDVIRSFAERMGRTAGLFQGGMGGGYYFHGMLHNQNVSLLGEIVDVGNSEGFVKTRAELAELWRKSNYAWWPDKLPEYKDLRGAELETALFFRMVHRLNARLASVTDGGLSEAQVKDIFGKAYREGRKGHSASDPRRTLTIKAEKPAGRDLDLSRYRRSDGTLDWKRLTRERALHEGAGAAHFALALFLKELAVVTATGDRARIEEFFEGLLTTDFYKQYGLFVAGARIGEVAYVRYLQRYVRPKFVNGILKTNLVLAAGIALPLIVEGNFEGKAFAISLGSLGLSSAAVKSGVAGLKWVVDLGKARRAGTLARVPTVGRLAKLGGWFYTAAELAVVLYMAEVVETEVNERLDLAAARDELTEAGKAFFKTANSSPSEAALGEAADAYHQAWIDYRNFLYAPLYRDEAMLASRLERVARQAKVNADQRRALVERVAGKRALKANILARHGSLEKYADHLLRRDEAEIEKQVNTYLESYRINRDKHLLEVYEANRRGKGLLADTKDIDQLLATAGNEPYPDRSDLFARFVRWRAGDSLAKVLGGASQNRLEAYDDEAALLAAAITRLRKQGQPRLADALEGRRAGVLELKAADERLIAGDGQIETRAGIVDALQRGGR